jgi:predicted nucleic acid-binding protein
MGIRCRCSGPVNHCKGGRATEIRRQPTFDNYADAVLDHLSRTTAIVPAIWGLEVVNLLLVAERQQRLKPADSFRFLPLLSQLPIVVDNIPAENSMKDLLALGRSGRLSSYDAAYLDLAMRRRCPLATLDE